MTVLSTLLLLVASAFQGEAADSVVVFRRVQVIPMTEEIVLVDRTVVVRDGVIVAIGAPDEVEVPKGALEVLDGGYLMPGLADMHTHVQSEYDLGPFLANGVTTILNMGGPSTILDLRDRVEEGELLGPRIFAGMYVDGTQPTWWLATNPQQARELVARAVEDRWDCIKVYNALSTDTFEALMDEAKGFGIPVVGHAVREPGMRRVLEAGMVMVAHAEEYLYGFFGNDRGEDRVAEAVAFTSEAGAFVTPNLSTYEVIAEQWGERRATFLEKTLARPEAEWMRPELIESWKASRKYAGRSGGLEDSLLFLRTFVAKLHASGVPLLLGTDSPSDDIIGLFPGWMIHRDLAALVRCGLTPYAALSAGTSVAGQFVDDYLRVGSATGTISVGARADLVLLSANPLDDVAHVREPRGVMVHGHWLDEGDLDALLVSHER